MLSNEKGIELYSMIPTYFLNVYLYMCEYKNKKTNHLNINAPTEYIGLLGDFSSLFPSILCFLNEHILLL